MDKYFINYSYQTEKYYVKEVGYVDASGLSIPLGEFSTKIEAINFMDSLEKTRLLNGLEQAENL